MGGGVVEENEEKKHPEESDKDHFSAFILHPPHFYRYPSRREYFFDSTIKTSYHHLLSEKDQEPLTPLVPRGKVTLDSRPTFIKPSIHPANPSQIQQPSDNDLNSRYPPKVNHTCT